VVVEARHGRVLILRLPPGAYAARLATNAFPPEHSMPRPSRRVRLTLLALPLVLAPVVAGLSAPPAEPDPAPAFLVFPYLQLPTPTGMTILWETNQKLPGKVEYGPTRDLGQSVDSEKAAVLQSVALKDLKPATTYFYRIRAGDLTSDVYSFKTAPALGTQRWRMVVYGDSRSNPPVHAKVAEGIGGADPDLIVHTGDIVLNGKNHDSWRKEFFDPLGPLARSVPWVSTIGNHERDDDNYFSYMALPDKEHYFEMDFADARILCLDSNAWIQKGRDSEQGKWLIDQVARKHDALWTFVVFHHPLFSAHATRPINPLRWDWAPIFLDPANQVDAVLTGHDHFYARNYRMGRLSDKPQPGVLFLTTAGGAAPLYPCKERDYVAKTKSAWHYTLFDFDGDKATITAVDVAGKEIDRWTLTKDPTPPDEFCAYEIEELRRDLRTGLAAAQPVKAAEKGPTTIDRVLSIPTHFAVPVEGKLGWSAAEGWTMKEPNSDFHLAPGEPLKIPLRAEVGAGSFSRNPSLTITFDPGRFRNRVIEIYPFQLGGPEKVIADRTDAAPMIDGKLDDKAWHDATAWPLLGLPPLGGRSDHVRLAEDADNLYLAAALDDPDGKVEVRQAKTDGDGGRSVLSQEHVALYLTDGMTTHTFALTPEQLRYYEGAKDAPPGWQAAAARNGTTWCVEMAVPRLLFADWSKVRVNVTHRRREGKDFRDLHLCPSFTSGNDPDQLPDWKPSTAADRFALVVTGG
jgi:hypothetical protein